MTANIIEKLQTISKVMSDLINFVQTDKDIKPDFNEYLTTMGVKEYTSAQAQAVCLPYIFERNINSKNIMELFLEKGKKATKYARTILKGLVSSVSSIFEVKKILKNGFELYNLVNEKTYMVISLVKMTSIVGYIAVQDLTKASDIIRSRTFDAFFPLIMAAVLYLSIAWLLTWALDYVEVSVDPKKRRMTKVKEEAK